MDQLDGPAGRTSWTDQFFLFEDFPFSLYIVAASESDEGLVLVENRSLVYFKPFHQFKEFGLEWMSSTSNLVGPQGGIYSIRYFWHLVQLENVRDIVTVLKEQLMNDIIRFKSCKNMLTWILTLSGVEHRYAEQT